MRNKSVKPAFTLIEVMIAVVIISTVIMALIQMYANNIHIFSTLKSKTNLTQYGTLLVANPEVGFEKKEFSLYDLVDGFQVEDDLRRELKNQKVKIIYSELEKIDLAEFSDEEDEDKSNEEISDEPNKEQSQSNMILEIGKTTLKFKEGATSIVRIELK